MKSISITYPRVGERFDILAGLFSLHNADLKINLPVQVADRNGIRISLPDFLSGIFYLKIVDGDRSFLKRIVLQ